ncbi:MAG: ABC transporter ATP-binding protein [Bacteroidales bacterium]|nr:ABC transporter ATP-binding protein [Bacteroidales bacterium]
MVTHNGHTPFPEQLSLMAKTLRLMLQHHPWKLVRILLLTGILGVSGGFSILLLIPLLRLLNLQSGDAPDGFALWLQQLMERTGMELSIGNILLLFVLILALNALLRFRKSMTEARYQQTFISDYRRQLFGKVLRAEWSTLHTKSKTNHIQVLTVEVPNLAEYIFYLLRFLTSLVITLAYIAYALAISPLYTLLILATGGILFFLLRKFLAKAFRLGEGYVSSYNHLLKYIDDFWQTVKIAKVHSSEDFYSRKFDQASSSLLDLEYGMQKNYALPRLIYSIAGIAVLALVIYLGFSMGQIPLASLFVLILLFSKIFPQFTGLITDIHMIISNLPSVQMVFRLDDEFRETAVSPAPTGASFSFSREILLDRISFGYPGAEPLFRNFSAVIPCRQITGIMGESGLGKTTLIDLIAGLQKPQDGSISVDGRPLNDDALPSWKNSIGYLPQDSFFIDGTFRENLVWDTAHPIPDEEIWNLLEQVNAAHLVKRYPGGLDAMVVNFPFTFSGGERQRLALARVLLRNPRLLLLDEATSSLDSDNEQQIMEVIAQLKNRVTILFVTHRTSLLPWFDQVIRL